LLYDEYVKIFDDTFKDELQKSKENESEKIRKKEEENNNGNMDVPIIDNEEETDVKQKEEKDSFITSLFKKIAKKIHPDKINDETDEYKEKCNELYLESQKNLNDNNLAGMLSNAKEIGIDISDIPEIDIKTLEKNIIKIENDINILKSTAAWLWCTIENNKRDSLKSHLYKLWGF